MLYSHTGQPSLDLVVFFKLMLVSRLENLVSDRRLVETYALRLDTLYFLGYKVDEDLPWHSTISHAQALDSAPVKANPSLESLCDKQPADAVTPILRVNGEPVPDAPVAPSTASISS